MPELPEVETVRRGLNQVTLDQPILGGEVLLSRTIAHPEPAAFVDGLSGSTIAQWHRRGKYLLAELTNAGEAAGWLGVHLRMSGQLLWVFQNAAIEKHCRARIFFPHQHELRFVDQRTFGQLWWVPPGQLPETVISGLTRLGPEPFSEAFSIAYMQNWLRDRRRPIKTALLDQGLVAGVGNIYADEALFLSGVHPQTHCAKLNSAQVEKLHYAIQKVLQQGIESGGTTISTFRNVEGVNGRYGGVAWVYSRDGEPCKNCSTTIQRLKLSGRSAHFCPQCQQ